MKIFQLKEALIPFKRRMRIKKLWDGILTGTLISIVPALFSVFNKLNAPWIELFFLLIVLGILLNLLRPEKNIVFQIDKAADARGEIITLTDMKESDSSPYFKILSTRVKNHFEKTSPKNVVSIKIRIRSLITLLITLVLLGIFILIPQYLDQNASQRVLQESTIRLAQEAAKNQAFKPIAEKLKELVEDIESDKTQEKLKELSMDITEQIRELERNAFAELFEEKGKDHEQSLGELERGEMSLSETREFILDLLSDQNLSGDNRTQIQNSYRDFTDSQGKTDEEKQRNLANDLLSEISPQDEIKEMKEVLRDFDEALNISENKISPQTDTQDRETAGRNSRRLSEETGGDPLEEEGISGKPTTAAGSSSSNNSTERNFVPSLVEQQKAELPEGDILESGDRGVIRLPGKEEFILQRISPPPVLSQSVFEEMIDIDDIPADKENIVKNYFLSIGAVPD